MKLTEVITRAIKNDENSLVTVPDADRAFIDLLKTDGIEELDFSTESSGGLQLTGEFNGKPFRIRLVSK